MDYGQRSNKKQRILKIGELSKATEVSRDTIRFYETKGLLTEVTRPFKWNNYKDYSIKNIKRVQIIKYLQRFSFTLKECKQLLDERDLALNNCIDKSKAFNKKLKSIEEQINYLQETRDALIVLINEEK